MSTKDTKNSVLLLISKEINSIENFLVYIEPKNNQFKDRYRLPGGKLEKGGETYFQALPRELMEEFGIEIESINLMYEKANIMGGELFLCSAKIKNGEPIRKEEEVGEPNWINAENLFQSNLVPNCKLALYIFLLKTNIEKLNSLINIISADKEFISHLEKEAVDIYEDLMTRIRIKTY